MNQHSITLYLVYDLPNKQSSPQRSQFSVPCGLSQLKENKSVTCHSVRRKSKMISICCVVSRVMQQLRPKNYWQIIFMSHSIMCVCRLIICHCRTLKNTSQLMSLICFCFLFFYKQLFVSMYVTLISIRYKKLNKSLNKRHCRLMLSY